MPKLPHTFHTSLYYIKGSFGHGQLNMATCEDSGVVPVTMYSVLCACVCVVCVCVCVCAVCVVCVCVVCVCVVCVCVVCVCVVCVCVVCVCVCCVCCVWVLCVCCVCVCCVCCVCVCCVCCVCVCVHVRSQEVRLPLANLFHSIYSYTSTSSFSATPAKLSIHEMRIAGTT